MNRVNYERTLESDLLGAVVEVANGSSELAERRQLMLESLAELVAADAGLWAWGYGRPEDANVATLAALQVGLSIEQLSKLQEFSLSKQSTLEFQMPLMRFLDEGGILCATRRDVICDSQWNENSWVWQSVRGIGKDAWLHSVRYGVKDAWSSVLMFRNVGRPEFEAPQKELLYRAIATVNWLWANQYEGQGSKTFASITPRQRTVMWMLLDGLSRRAIAEKLNISEDTVGDHIKAIYERFRVNSATELAALFLRSK